MSKSKKKQKPDYKAIEEKAFWLSIENMFYNAKDDRSKVATYGYLLFNTTLIALQNKTDSIAIEYFLKDITNQVANSIKTSDEGER